MFKQLSAFIATPSGLLLLVFFFIPWITVSCDAGPLGEEDISSSSGYALATGNAYDQFEDGLIEAYLNGAGLVGAEDVFSDPTLFPEGNELSLDDIMATDDTVSDTADPESLDALRADSTLWVLPVVALLVLLIGVASFTDLLPAIGSGVVYLLGAIGGIAVLALKFMDLQDFATELAEQTAPEEDIVFALQYEAGFYLTAFALIGIFVAGVIAILFDAAPAPTRKPTATAPAPDLSFFQDEQPNEPPPKPSWFNDAN